MQLIQILILESAHHICTLRCKRVIKEKSYNERKIVVRWNRNIDKRLIKNKTTATKIELNRHMLQKAREIW